MTKPGNGSTVFFKTKLRACLFQLLLASSTVVLTKVQQVLIVNVCRWILGHVQSPWLLSRSWYLRYVERPTLFPIEKSAKPIRTALPSRHGHSHLTEIKHNFNHDS